MGSSNEQGLAALCIEYLSYQNIIFKAVEDFVNFQEKKKKTEAIFYWQLATSTDAAPCELNDPVANSMSCRRQAVHENPIQFT